MNVKNKAPKNSVCAFMEHIIDYAGLFPPASLPIQMAISNYAAYRSSHDAWMLGRFILPASQLDELEPHVSLFSPEVPLSLSVIGRKSENWSDCYQGLLADLKQIDVFRERHGDIVEIGVLELPLPSITIEGECLEVIGQETAERGLQTFCELPFPRNEEWEIRVLKMLDVIAAHNATGKSVLGVKLRTGGVTADAFPTPDQVAVILIGCRDRKIAVKFTAGLHHPFRMYRNEVNTRMHGFINVFTAGMLSHVHKLDRSTMAEILTDEQAQSFSFHDNSLSWRDISLSVQDIVRLRVAGLCTYGSCSFDEPREDLRALHIL